MPIKPDAPFPKTSGDNLRSKDWNDAVNELIRLDNAKADRAGDKFTGPLSVTALGISTDAPPSGIKIKTLTRIDEGPGGAGAWANIGSNVYFDGAWKQVDASKPGVSLHLNADGGGQEFRFLRMEANAQTKNVATIGSNGITLTDAPTISTSGRMHLTGTELCYLLHKSGVIVGKEWGGNGNLTVEGNLLADNVFSSRPFRVGAGKTPPGSTAWSQYIPSGITVNVDTSGAAFTQTPIYVVSLGGDSGHWNTTGGSSVYAAKPSGFTIYVRNADNSALTPASANSNNWHILWIGIQV